MTKIIMTYLFFMFLCICPVSLPAQVKSFVPDSAKIAECRDKIGLDMSIPDFETKKIDA